MDPRLICAWAKAAAAAMGLVVATLAATMATVYAAPPRQSAHIELESTGWTLTPYVDGTRGELVLHLQPRGGNAAERLIDARTGAPWPGTPTQLMARFTRLGLEDAREVSTGRGWDQQLLARLGCTSPVVHCSSPADAPVVLLVHALAGRRLAWQVVDLQPLMGAMQALMAGEREATALALEAHDWDLLQLAARSATNRQRWLDALRSIDSAERWQRVVNAARAGPRLLAWPGLRAEGDGLDLAGELERLAMTLHVTRLTRALASTSGQAAPRRDVVSTLADALLLASQSGFRGDLPSALVDVLLQLAPPERERLADELSTEATRRQSHGLWCYARWLRAEACGAQAPWMAQAPPQSSSAAASAQPAPAVPPTSPSRPTASATAPPPPASPAHSTISEAPQEWALIQRQPQAITLLSYDETSGHLVPESGAAAGLAFVARSLGPLQQGRFELQIAPNSRAPLRLAHGAYRVKVRLVLDYAREDRCRAGLLCLFGGSERHARTERRDVVFELDAANRYVERRRADFGHLLPLAADGNQRYASTLTQARLAIEAVRFELR